MPLKSWQVFFSSPKMSNFFFRAQNACYIEAYDHMISHGHKMIPHDQKNMTSNDVYYTCTV